MTGHRTHKISKVMTTLSDMVMQCGGGGCCVLEQCFQYPRRAREPRDCGCQFALLHRADIAWPSVLANNLYFYYCLFFFFLFFFFYYYRYVLFPLLLLLRLLHSVSAVSLSLSLLLVLLPILSRCAFRVSAFTMCASLWILRASSSFTDWVHFSSSYPIDDFIDRVSTNTSVDKKFSRLGRSQRFFHSTRFEFFDREIDTKKWAQTKNRRNFRACQLSSRGKGMDDGFRRFIRIEANGYSRKIEKYWR